MNGQWWVTDLLNDPRGDGVVRVVSTVVWVIGSIVLHELAHGWAAIRLGDRTPIETGHMSANPLVHMGPMSLAMFALVGIAWGQMPVDPSRMRGRHADAIVSFAGPAMNLALAAASLVAWGGLAYAASRSAGPLSPLAQNLDTFFTYGMYLNVALAMFNLLPVPPLDGSRMLSSFVPAYREVIRGGSERVAVVLAVLMIAMYSGGGAYLFGAARTVTGLAQGVVVDMIVAGVPGR